MNLTGILKGAVLVTFDDLPADHGNISIVCATVVQDCVGRFPSGGWIYTSCVEKIEGDLVHTLNSIYKIEGVLERMALPIEALSALKDGAPPKAVKGLIDAGYKFVTPHVAQENNLGDDETDEVVS